MGGVSSGALTPQAKWRGKRETGGSLFAAGAGALLVHSIRMIFVLCIVASILLIAGSALTASFLYSLRVETASLQSIGGIGFLAYAILSAIGVLLFAGSLLTIFMNPLSAQVGLLVPITIGA